MRLIDADELTIYIDHCQCCSKCNNKHFHCDDECELPDGLTEQWKRVIDEQPTVDPVKHAHWANKPGTGIFVCSNCRHFFGLCSESNEPTFKYCPNCGAKMDEVNE